MPNRRRSPKTPPLDIDRELDDMYSSPITRPNLAFLQVAGIPSPSQEDLSIKHPSVAGSADNAPSPPQPSNDSTSRVVASIDERSHESLHMQGLTRSVISTVAASMDGRSSLDSPKDYKSPPAIGVASPRPIPIHLPGNDSRSTLIPQIEGGDPLSHCKRVAIRYRLIAHLLMHHQWMFDLAASGKSTVALRFKMGTAQMNNCYMNCCGVQQDLSMRTSAS